MVFDVPAESGGALTVLNDFYNVYKKDEKNNYIFIVSKPELKECKNIEVLHYQWVKKSWLYRFYFDKYIAPKLIIEHKVDYFNPFDFTMLKDKMREIIQG